MIAASLLLVMQSEAVIAQSAYRIQPGDVLQLDVLQDSSLNQKLLVLPDGTVNVPMVGTISAAGQTVEELRAAMTKDLSPSFSVKPTVYLSVAALAPKQVSTVGAAGRQIPIYIMGEVTKPGQADVSRGTTLIQALAISGGFTNFAAKTRIELVRQDSAGHQQVYTFNFENMLSGTQSSPVVLKPGDVIIVPQRNLFE